MATPEPGDQALSARASGAGPRYGEFVALVALMISLVALSIDAMLPALATIGAELGARQANDAQLILSALFLGLAFAQVIYGPLSDSFGRKPTIYLGFGLFIGGCLLSALATSFAAMLIGRFLQGIGAAGPRIVTIAMVRDLYEGRAMARIMSSVMAVFILVPALAPGIGQLILMVASWRAIFGAFLAVASIAVVWFGIRQPETLSAAHRASFSLRRIAGAAREVCGHPVAFGYTLAAGLIFGALIGYLTSAAQIFQGQYGLGERFPIYFAALALAIGLASWCNSRLVMRYGMRLLSGVAVVGLGALSVGFFAIALGTGRSSAALGPDGLSFGRVLLLRHLVRQFQRARHGAARPHRGRRGIGRRLAHHVHLAAARHPDRPQLQRHRAAAGRRFCDPGPGRHGGHALGRTRPLIRRLLTPSKWDSATVTARHR